MKFHILAITCICLTVIAVFQLKPKEQQAAANAPVVLSSHFVIIYSASWGMNCADQIARVIQSPQMAAKPVTSNPNAPKPTPPTMPHENNALVALSELCNNKETCTFTPTKEVFGNLGVPCFKNLDVGYRCFEFDKIHYISGKDGKEMTIDCSKAKE